MTQRTPLIVLLACLAATAAWGQAYTAPAGDGPKPAMIVSGRALAPAAWVEGVHGDTVTLDGVEMMWIGAATKDAGGEATIEQTPQGRTLHLSVGMRTMDFQILSPGLFWRHPWVRDLIAVSHLQPMPYWPYEEANIPARAPHGVSWKRPYLDWKPDEAWLLLHLQPPAPPEPAPAEVEEEDEAEEAEEAEAEEAEEAEAEEAAEAAPGGPPGGGPPGGGPPGGMMGGPPAGEMEGGPGPGGPAGEPGMTEPPPGAMEGG